MSHRKPLHKIGVFVFAILLILTIWSRCRTGSTSAYERIRAYVDTIKVINTHEHQRIFSEYEGQQLNFYSLLAHTYLQSDLVSAGATPLNPELCNRGDLDQLWEMNGRYLDLVWLPQISREAAIHTLVEMLNCVPYNKFFWGGDCHFIEESTGSLEFGKDVVSEVLARRVNAGLMLEETARDVALKTFRENAVTVFKLKEKILDDSNL